MQTHIDIDDHLMNEALQRSQLDTKKDVIESALRLLIEVKKQERILQLRKKIRLYGVFGQMNLDQ